MKIDTKKLYKQMEPLELANLAIAAIQRKDEAESQTILNSVETALYRLPVNEYRKQIHAYTQLSFIYGLYFYKHQAMFAQAELCYQAMEDDKLLHAKSVFLSRLASIEQALKDVCSKAKLDIQHVKWLAEVKDGILPEIPDFFQSPEQVKNYTELFSAAANL